MPPITRATCAACSTREGVDEPGSSAFERRRDTGISTASSRVSGGRPQTVSPAAADTGWPTASDAGVDRGSPGSIYRVDERTAYVVEKEITDRNDAAMACVAVLEVLGPVLRVALVDAYSDYENEVPPDVEEAQRWVRQQGANQQRDAPVMSVEVAFSTTGIGKPFVATPHGRFTWSCTATGTRHWQRFTIAVTR